MLGEEINAFWDLSDINLMYIGYGKIQLLPAATAAKWKKA